MEPAPPPPPPAPIDERCYRHPDVETGVHCTRCGRPICTNCMARASVGFQCPECVREAQAEFRRGPGRRDAIANVRGISATTVLLALMALGYAWMIVKVGTGAIVSGPSPQEMYELGGSVGIAVGDRAIGLAAGEYWRLVSPIFLHYGLLHLAVNAYSLWIVGRIVEDEYGRWREVAIFFATGIVASAASYALVSAEQVAVGAGASGAIAGLFGVVLAHAYGRRHTALGAARMRAIGQVLVLNLLISFTSSVIDWRAHLGGFLAGIVAGWLAEPSRRGGAIANVVGIAAVGVAGFAIAVAKTQALVG